MHLHDTADDVNNSNTLSTLGIAPYHCHQTVTFWSWRESWSFRGSHTVDKLVNATSYIYCLQRREVWFTRQSLSDHGKSPEVSEAVIRSTNLQMPLHTYTEKGAILSTKERSMIYQSLTYHFCSLQRLSNETAREKEGHFYRFPFCSLVDAFITYKSSGEKKII